MKIFVFVGRHVRRLRWFICFAAVAIAVNAQAQRKLMVAAASDLKFALDSVIADYHSTRKDVRIVTTYSASGKIYEQLSNGAPFDIFFSADVAYPEQLHKAGKTAGPVRKYAVGHIVIWSRRFDPNQQGMQLLLDSRIKKIAIANPDHAPYGRRTVEALKHAGVYDRLLPKLVYGENISQTAQFVTTGAADAGFVALSLARSPAMRDGKYFLMPAESHQPLEQAMVIMKRAAGNSDATDFQEFVLGERSKAILAYFGFSEPK